MGLIIESGETKLIFSVERIGNNNTKDYNDLDYWLIIKADVENRFFNYHHNEETLEYRDLITIRDSFDSLLKGDINERTEIGFIEPDFEFVLYPPVRFSELDKPLEIWRTSEEACADFVIYLTESDFSYNGERYIYPLVKNEIIAWRDYLNEAIIEFNARNIMR